MSLIKYRVTRYSNLPVPVEYARETANYYIHPDGRRDAKISRYYRYFDTEAESLQFIAERQQAEKDAKRLKQIEKAAPDLLTALQKVMADLPGDGLDDWYVMATAAIAKATGGDL